MGLRLQKLYRSWEDNPDVGFIALKGSGKAFCAGGDVVSLYHLINQGRMEDCKEFFRALYPFIYLLGTCLKPHVAILNGVTTGGGAGVSIPGTFRIATDKNDGYAICIPIIGIGGIAKTTLAQLAYNDERVIQHFDVRMWTFVSDDLNIKKIMTSVIESVTRED